MSNLESIFGGPWSPPAERYIAPLEDQLRIAMQDAGINPPDVILIDGQIHRFKSKTKGSGSKGGDKPGWYVAFPDGVPAGKFGCYSAGLESIWRADIGRKFTASEEMAHVRRMSEAKALRDADLAKKQEIAANTAETIWSECTAAHPDHPYLKLKNINVNGARVTGDGRLVVPMFSEDADLSSLQYIPADGKDKRYHQGGAVKGRFWMLGEPDQTIYIAEGFATAATIRDLTNQCVVVAYSAGNLVSVTEIMRNKYGATQNIVIIADNDRSGTGQRYAEQASAKYGARVVMPPNEGEDVNDYVNNGNSLADLLMPPVDDWLIAADDFCAQPAPLSWLIKHWVQTDALIMVHGPSGGGKTFVVLDWCMRIASNMSEWCGKAVKDGSIVYLAGEGHHGLKSRIAAWKHHHKSSKLNMYLSRSGCDLNTPAGYQQVVDHIRMLPEKPSMIVVDTLHRFLLGDENSSQDAKTMLDACGALMQEFRCSVLLVHHTGVSDEAQHRARGSSAWRGALDIEVSIVPGSEDKPMQIVQRKSKDAEIALPIFVELQSIAIPGWIDEDGEAVTSAVILQVDAPIENIAPSKVSVFTTEFKRAWIESAYDFIGVYPYVSRSALIEYLIKCRGVTRSTAETYCKESKDNIIGTLINNQIIQPDSNGWKVVDPIILSVMLLEKESNV